MKKKKHTHRITNTNDMFHACLDCGEVVQTMEWSEEKTPPPEAEWEVKWDNHPESKYYSEMGNKVIKSFIHTLLADQKKEVFENAIMSMNEAAEESIRQKVLKEIEEEVVPSEKETDGNTVFSTPEDGWNLCIETIKENFKKLA